MVKNKTKRKASSVTKNGVSYNNGRYYINEAESSYDNPCEEDSCDDVDLALMVKRSMVNEIVVRAFVSEYQPESDERQPFVIALSMGQVREYMQIFRTFDDKMPDPLQFYLERLEKDGFKIRMGFSNEPVLLVSHRNNGRTLRIEEPDTEDMSRPIIKAAIEQEDNVSRG